MKTNMAMTALLIFALLAGCSSGEKIGNVHVDKEADTQLKAMSTALGSADRLRMEVEFSSESGFPEIMQPGTLMGKLVVDRPDKAASLLTTEGHRRSFIYDGARVVLVDWEGMGYAEVPAPGTLDETITMLEEEYATEPILSDFLYKDLYTNLLEAVKKGENPELKAVKYVGVEDVGGTQAHHLLFNEEFIDWDLWIAEDTSLPVRIEIVGTPLEDKPKMEIQFLKVEINGAINPDLFIFEATEGMDKIPVAKPDQD